MINVEGLKGKISGKNLGKIAVGIGAASTAIVLAGAGRVESQSNPTNRQSPNSVAQQIEAPLFTPAEQIIAYDSFTIASECNFSWVETNHLATGDFDNNSKLDVALVNSVGSTNDCLNTSDGEQQLWLYSQNERGRYVRKNNFRLDVPTWNTSLQAIDLDQDKWQDLLYSGPDGFAVLYNEKGQRFTQTRIPTPWGIRNWKTLPVENGTLIGMTGSGGTFNDIPLKDHPFTILKVDKNRNVSILKQYPLRSSPVGVDGLLVGQFDGLEGRDFLVPTDLTASGEITDEKYTIVKLAKDGNIIGEDVQINDLGILSWIGADNALVGDYTNDGSDDMTVFVGGQGVAYIDEVNLYERINNKFQRTGQIRPRHDGDIAYPWIEPLKLTDVDGDGFKDALGITFDYDGPGTGLFPEETAYQEFIGALKNFLPGSGEAMNFSPTRIRYESDFWSTGTAIEDVNRDGYDDVLSTIGQNKYGGVAISYNTRGLGRRIPKAVLPVYNLNFPLAVNFDR